MTKERLVSGCLLRQGTPAGNPGHAGHAGYARGMPDAPE